MENISLKQWIIAGTLSGTIIGVIFFFTFTFIFRGTSFLYPLFIWDAFFGHIFLGIVIGTILFLVNDKFLKKKLSKCLIVSILSIIVISLLSIYFYAHICFGPTESLLVHLIPLFPVAIISLATAYYFGVLWPFLYFFIGIAFGFLINYFINRIERKTSE